MTNLFNQFQIIPTTEDYFINVENRRQISHIDNEKNMNFHHLPTNEWESSMYSFDKSFSIRSVV